MTIIIMTVLFYKAGFGNLGGSLFFGTVVAISEVAIYYLLENKEDKESCLINAIIAVISLLIMIFILKAC